MLHIREIRNDNVKNWNSWKTWHIHNWIQLKCKLLSFSFQQYFPHTHKHNIFRNDLNLSGLEFITEIELIASNEFIKCWLMRWKPISICMQYIAKHGNISNVVLFNYWIIVRCKINKMQFVVCFKRTHTYINTNTCMSSHERTWCKWHKVQIEINFSYFVNHFRILVGFQRHCSELCRTWRS